MAITVGCDPEFLLVNGMESDARPITFSMNHSDEHGNIGSDHGGRVGELRPKAGTPKEVVEHIRAQMKYIKQHKPDAILVAGGGQKYGEAIGGHIHIGGIQLTNHYSSFTRQANRGRMKELKLDTVNPEHKLIYALDFFIGRRMNKMPGAKRGGTHYGKPSDIETKSHGFEYRTPPSWLTDPKIAEAVLVVAQKIAELWQTKPTAFDCFIQTGKTAARRKDYNVLIPNANEYAKQYIEFFKATVFSKTYFMDKPEVLKAWTEVPVMPKVQSQELVKAVTTQTEIQLKICQLKLVNYQSDGFTTETVANVCRFALPEVKIHALTSDYAPWQFQLVNDLRLRPDTAYFSKELRPFLKVKRGKDIRVRFVELKRRVAIPEGNGRGQVRIEPIENMILFNSSRSTKDVLEHVLTVFKTGARTKLRAVADDGDDE